MDKWNKCIYMIKEYSEIKRTRIMMHATTEESWKHVKWKESVSKDTVLHNSIYMRCSEYIKSIDRR